MPLNLPTYPDDEEKKIIGVIFDKRAYMFRTDVDMWLYSNGYDADLYNIEESPLNYRVMLCGKMLGGYDQQSMETKEDPSSLGIKYIIAKECEAMKFAVEAPQNESALGDWFQILYAGSFKKYGYEFELTAEVLDAMVSNFERDVLKKKHLPIDYSHNNDQKAAGWITALKTNEEKTALYAKANWTPAGKQALLEREFSYFSAEFLLDHRDAETDTDHGPVLRGGALTNIPFLKLPPIIPLHQDGRELSAIFFQEDKNMAEDIKLAELTKTVKEQADKIASLSASAEKVVELAAKHESAMSQLAEEKALNKQLRDRIELDDKNKAFDKLLKDGQACEAQRDAFIKNNMVEFAQKAQKVNLVNPRREEVVTDNVVLDEAEQKVFDTHFAPRGIKLDEYIKMSRSKVSTHSLLTPVSKAAN